MSRPRRPRSRRAEGAQREGVVERLRPEAREERGAPAAVQRPRPSPGRAGQSPIRPNLRMSRKRISRPSASASTRWTYGSTGVAGRHHEELAGHLQVDRQRRARRRRARTTTQLGPPPDRLDPPPGDGGGERLARRVRRDRPRPVAARADDRRADDEPAQVARDRLDLGKLGHGRAYREIRRRCAGRCRRRDATGTVVRISAPCGTSVDRWRTARTTTRSCASARSPSPSAAPSDRPRAGARPGAAGAPP